MDYSDLHTIVPSAGAIVAIGSAWLTVRKIAKDAKRERKELVAEILQEAKEADTLIKSKLESRIEAIRAELKNLEFNVSKDVEHLRETQKNEMKNLGEKIETLRDELRNKHSELVQLLTAMVNKD